MASGTFYPAVQADDGSRYSTSSFSIYNYLTIGNYNATIYHIFVRFPNVTIPEGVTITSAFIRFTAQAAGSATVCNEELSLNDVDNAVAPTNYSEYDALVKTTAKVDWTAIGSWSTDVQYDSVDIKTALQEVIDRAGWSSGNAVMLLGDGTDSDASAHRQADVYDGTGKAELHVTWDTGIFVETTDGAGMSDAYELDTPYRDVIEDTGIADSIGIVWELQTTITNGAGIADNIAGIFEVFAEITDGVGITDAYAKYIEASRSITDGTGTADDLEVIRIFNKTVVETLSAWVTLKWGWNKTIADSLAIADTASKILGIPVKEWLTLTDTETNNWNGTESLSDSFYAVDISKAIQVYEDLLADGMAVTDAVKISLELIITDILTCTDTVINTGIFQHSIEDGMTLVDVAKRLFPKSISDSFAATDTSLVDFLALLQISDSFNAADTASRLLTINQTIADSLEALDTVTVQQLIYELIQEGLNFDVSVIIDGEVWECWALNTSRFHPSVYSNYEFNSFAIDRSNNICYGCKSDGIYTLEGDTDDGTPIRAGIILPDTQMGSANNKRFRKAWLAVDGDNLILKAETESGSKTYRMTDTEISLTRDLKGRSFLFSVEGFNSLDSIELVPIILSKK